MVAGNLNVNLAEPEGKHNEEKISMLVQGRRDMSWAKYSGSWYQEGTDLEGGNSIGGGELS